MNGNSSDSQSSPPDEQVAQRIVAQLLAGGLIVPQQAEAVRRGLAAGTLKAADWRLLAENALQMEARHAQAH